MAGIAPTQTNNRFLRCLYASEVQTLGKQTITLKENHDWNTEVEKKTEEYHSLGQSMLRYLATADGLFRFGQFAERMPKFANAVRQELGLSGWTWLDSCTSKSQLAWTWLTTVPRAITMTPGTIRDVKEANAALKDKTQTGAQVQFKIEKAFSAVTDTCSMWAWSVTNMLSLFPSMSKMQGTTTIIAEQSTFVHDVSSLKINAQNLSRAHALIRSPEFAKATPAMKETVEGTRTYNMWAVAKDVTSVVSGFFGLLLLVSGIAVLPGIAFVALSLASTVLAVIRKMAEETMTYKPISFLDNKQVTLVTV